MVLCVHSFHVYLLQELLGDARVLEPLFKKKKLECTLLCSFYMDDYQSSVSVMYSRNVTNSVTVTLKTLLYSQCFDEVSITVIWQWTHFAASLYQYRPWFLFLLFIPHHLPLPPHLLFICLPPPLSSSTSLSSSSSSFIFTS